LDIILILNGIKKGELGKHDKHYRKLGTRMDKGQRTARIPNQSDTHPDRTHGFGLILDNDTCPNSQKLEPNNNLPRRNGLPLTHTRRGYKGKRTIQRDQTNEHDPSQSLTTQLHQS
jgi:hypothetical protein